MKYLKNFQIFEKELVLSAKELLNTVSDKDYLKLKSPYKNMFGKVSTTFKLLLHGGPGSGKTTFLLKFANDLTSLGSVLYVSSEEFDSTTLVEKLKELMKKEGLNFELPDNLFFSKEIGNLKDYDFIIVDSVNDIGLGIDEFKEIKNKFKDKAFILVLQNTKAGDYKGGKEWEHEVDIAAKVENGVIDIFKNRYGVYSTYDFFNNKFVEDQEK
jgi:predicted ATP-dependent serine protease